MPQPSQRVHISARQLLLTAILLLLCAVATASPFPPQTGLFQQIGDEEQIPDNVVTRLLQDDKGFIWIGTPAGLIRYDGYRFRRYQQQSGVSNALPGNFITDMLLQPDGSIWLIAEPGGVSVYRPQTDDFQPLNLSASAEQKRLLQYARTLTRDKDGTIWLGGRDGFMAITVNGDKTGFYQFDSALTPLPSQIRSLLAVEHLVFIGAKEGLFVFDKQQQHLRQLELPFAEQNSVTQVLSLALQTDNSLWIGTASQGLFRLDLSNWHSEKIATGSVDGNETAINTLLPVNEYQLWLGRFDGIDAIDSRSKRWLGKVSTDRPGRYSLLHSDIRTLLLDQAGQIWAGGYGSGVKLYQGQTAVTVLNDSLPGPFRLQYDNVSSILERSNGDIWLGSRGDGVSVLSRTKGIVKHYAPAPGVSGQLQQGWVTTMAEQASGDIWLGVNPAQLYRFSAQHETFTALDNAQSFWHANVRKLFTDSSQRLWLGSNEGAGLWLEQTQQFQRILDQNDLPIADYINGFAEDHQQNLWLATGSSGLLKIDSNTLSASPAVFSADSPQAPQSILGILFDQQNRLWLDTPNGLFVINDTARQPLLLSAAQITEQPLQSDLGANLLQDRQGRLWTQRHLYQPDSGLLYPLSTADGIYHGTNWYRSYTQTRDGLLLFGGNDGVVIIQPEQFKRWNYLPKVVATSIKIDGKPANSSAGTLQLAPESRGFSVEFAGLDLSAPGRLQYRYQLQGFDQDWRYTDATQRQATYTNLWPGNYQLIIESTNRAQQWSPHSYQLHITVAAAFWQTPGFMLLVLTLLVMSVYGVIKLRTRLLRRQAKALALQIAHRTAELQSTQKALHEKEKMAALGQLVAGIAHEINTPLGISVTASSLLQENTTQLQQQFEQKNLTSSQLQQFLQQSQQNLDILLSNLHRSADLVQTFKEVAIDESMAAVECVNLYNWLTQRIQLLGASIKPHQVEIQCPVDLTLHLATKASEIVIVHLLNNSLIHGFEHLSCGKINISVQYEAGICTLIYQDNGAGVSDEVRHTLFDPFVTTKRGRQCKGLGLHLCFNLITQVMAGTITLQQDQSSGAQFSIRFPAKLAGKS